MGRQNEKPGVRAWIKRLSAKKERRKVRKFAHLFDLESEPAPPSLDRKHHPGCSVNSPLP
jgi:hypothetical protein